MASRTRVVEVVRVGVEEADPGHLGLPLEPVQEGGQAVLHPEVAPVVRGVLGHEEDLLHAAGREVPHLAHDVLRRAGSAGGPRKVGMGQKEQGLSHPSAIFT